VTIEVTIGLKTKAPAGVQTRMSGRTAANVAGIAVYPGGIDHSEISIFIDCILADIRIANESSNDSGEESAYALI
jgi:hypothetical protein